MNVRAVVAVGACVLVAAGLALAGNDFASYGPDSRRWAHPAGRYCYRFRSRRREADTVEAVPLSR